MEFKDYKPEELIGKKVAHTWGMPHSRCQEVKTIQKVSSNFFGLSKLNKVNFSLVDGQEKGDFRSSCRLITEEEAGVIENENNLKLNIQTKQSEILRYNFTSIKYNQENLEKLNKIIELAKGLER